jgi:hypothetical protein
MNKTIISACFIIIVGLFLSGCVDFSAGKRPDNQENTKWVSTDLDIWFEVKAEYGDITGSNTYGEINMGGVITEIAVSFDYGTGVEFRPVSAFKKGEYIDGTAWLFLGRCKFSDDKLVVDIFNNSNGFLDDSIENITFYREYIE